MSSCLNLPSTSLALAIKALGLEKCWDFFLIDK
jgi:hypothetical protein